MEYQVPQNGLNPELVENVKNIEKVIDQLNQRRDKGLSPELSMNCPAASGRGIKNRKPKCLRRRAAGY